MAGNRYCGGSHSGTSMLNYSRKVETRKIKNGGKNNDRRDYRSTSSGNPSHPLPSSVCLVPDHRWSYPGCTEGAAGQGYSQGYRLDAAQQDSRKRREWKKIEKDILSVRLDIRKKG